MIQESHNANADPELGDDPLAPSVLPNGSRPDQNPNFLKSKINEVQFPFVLVLGASIVLLIAVLMWEDGMTARGYILSVPSVSIVVSSLALVLTVFRDDLFARYGQRLAQLLFSWNFTGACFLTFSSPFTTTGNGYFAAWACVATSSMATGLTMDVFRERVQGLGSIMGLGTASFIVIFALIDYVGYQVPSSVRGESVYAMVIACFTVVLCGGLVYFQRQSGNEVLDGKEAMLKFVVLGIFAIFWLVLACLVTFSGPFEYTGNGYFASWCGAVCACSAAFNAKKEAGVKNIDLSNFTPRASATGLSATIT